MTTEVRLDLERGSRIGMGEAIFCPNKSGAQLRTILGEVAEAGVATLFTRLEQDAYAELNEAFPDLLDYDPVSRTAFFAEEPKRASAGGIAVITAGSSDVPVGREAVRTLSFYGEEPLEINDVGVAGLWRLTQRLPEIRDKEVLICVAGMDAALPTLIGGLVRGLVIAVPTSNGYGMARNGETALHALLCSCAPGLVVVNIDNGFGAACAALRAMRSVQAEATGPSGS